MSRRIAVLPGDGIGPEVISPALASLPDSYEIVTIDAGAERYLDTGEVITEGDLSVIRDCDALLFGAVGDPRVPDGVLERGIVLRIRQELDLYANVRPFPELDLVIVRENTEGAYSGVGERLRDFATEMSVNTRAAIERCVRYSFDLARSRSRRLTLVHKSNVLVHAGALWREVTEDVGDGYEDVEVSYEHADAAAYHLVTDQPRSSEPDNAALAEPRTPRSRFDVIVTDNLFGDILSDLAAGLAGGLGRAASANLHPDRATRRWRCVGMFEPVHGSAPDIAGKDLADPTAAVRAAAMMVDELDRSRDAAPA